MAILQIGWSYSQGEVTNPSGSVVFEFVPDLNPNLDALLINIGDLIGKEVDASGLPDSVTIDGTVYVITHEEDARQELIDAVTVLADELGVSNAKAKRIMKAIYKVIKAAKGWQ
jgi:hypothetical protein